MNSRRQFDIKNGVITNIKPYEIVAIIVSKLKIFGEVNTRNEVAESYIPMYWYASSKEEAEKLKETISQELENETIDGDIIIRHLPVIVIDTKVSQIQKDAGTNKGIERVIICTDSPIIDEGAFDKDTVIVSYKQKTKSRRI